MLHFSTFSIFVWILLCFSNSISLLGINALTVTSPTVIDVSLGSDSTILLNCTFEKKIGETVTRITWSKKNEMGDKYSEIVYYQSIVVYVDLDFNKRSNSTAIDESSFTSVIVNISEVQCRDNGQYKCIVDYLNSNGNRIRTSTETSVYIQGKDVSYLKFFM